MKRRTFGSLVAGSLSATKIPVSGKSPQKKRILVIPRSVELEIIKLIDAGGKITGLKYLNTSKGKWHSSGERFFTKPEEREWKVV